MDPEVVLKVLIPRPAIGEDGSNATRQKGAVKIKTIEDVVKDTERPNFYPNFKLTWLATVSWMPAKDTKPWVTEDFISQGNISTRANSLSPVFYRVK